MTFTSRHNCHQWSSICLEMKGRLEIGQRFFISSLFNPDFSSSWVIVVCFKHNGITDSAIDLLIMTVISGKCWSTYFLKIQVGHGSKSHVLFGDSLIIYMTSTSEASQNISRIFPLNIISVFMEILQVLIGGLEMISFLIIVIFLIKKFEKYLEQFDRIKKNYLYCFKI